MSNASCNACAAWVAYDNARDEFENRHDSWVNARTGRAADAMIPKLHKVREEYINALHALRALGFSPNGSDPSESMTQYPIESKT